MFPLKSSENGSRPVVAQTGLEFSRGQEAADATRRTLVCNTSRARSKLALCSTPSATPTCRNSALIFSPALALVSTNRIFCCAA
jgi:hypothetical protein